MKHSVVFASLVSIAPILAGGASFAQGVYKIGVATGQTGYLAVTDGPALKGLRLGVTRPALDYAANTILLLAALQRR